MNINIDKLELLDLCEGCSIGSHLRQGIWERCIDDELARGDQYLKQQQQPSLFPDNG